jgi:hypothetical protein
MNNQQTQTTYIHINNLKKSRHNTKTQGSQKQQRPKTKTQDSQKPQRFRIGIEFLSCLQ